MIWSVAVVVLEVVIMPLVRAVLIFEMVLVFGAGEGVSNDLAVGSDTAGVKLVEEEEEGRVGIVAARFEVEAGFRGLRGMEKRDVVDREA